MWHEPPANAILMFKILNQETSKSRHSAHHRYQIIIIYITQKRGANCIYPQNTQTGWSKTTDNIFTLVS